MSAALKLELFHNGAWVREIPVEGQVLWLGRGDECAIRLEDRAISRRHAALKPVEHGIEFEKKSKFGEVWINGREVEYATLKGGECLVLGPYELRVIRGEAEAVPSRNAAVEAPDPSGNRLEASGPEIPFESDASGDPLFGGSGDDLSDSPEELPGEELATPETSPEEAVVAHGQDGGLGQKGGPDEGFAFSSDDGQTRMFSAAQTGTKPVLEFQHADGIRVYEIVDAEIALGRSQNCHVVLEDKKSSRKHAILLQKDGRFTLRDLGSANGTLVNGERIEERELSSGDEIQIGDTRFTFRMVQADYEARKADFLQVPTEPEPAPRLPVPEYAAPMEPFSQGGALGGALASPLTMEPGMSEPPLPDFGSPEPETKSLIGKFLDRYRAMPLKGQILYGVGILAVFYFLMDDSEPEKKPRLITGVDPKAAVKKDEKKPSGPGTQSFETLTPEQKAYVESQYKIAFEYYRNREYDAALLELEKIFALVSNYSSAREIEAFAREGKRKLAALEEERKRREQERETQVRLQALIDQAGLLMDARKYKDAEALFPEIELIQPENATVAEWRKKMIEETERMEREAKERARLAQLRKEALGELAEAQKLIDAGEFFSALERLDALLLREGMDRELSNRVKKVIRSTESALAEKREPLIAQGKELEKSLNFTEAYKAYYQAAAIDPGNEEAPAGMERIQGVLTSKAKAVYSEGVIAESFSDFDIAEKKYREVLEIVPPEHDYFSKASKRIRRILSARKPASEGIPQ